MTPFEITILYHNESTKMLKSINMPFSYESLDVVPMMLFNIDGAHSHMNNGIEYTEIYTGTGTVVAPMSYREFLELYKKHNP
jgi:hypothetical protein